MCVGIVAFAAVAVGARAGVTVQVARVGYPTLRMGHVVRTGAWTPIVVRLALVNQDAFHGTLRVAQEDNDGDRCYDSAEVHLSSETGGELTRYLYVPANPKRGARFAVELIDDDREMVEVVSNGVLTRAATPAARPNVITDDAILILSISDETLGRERDLVEQTEGLAINPFHREIHVGHIAPRDLPGLWIGLDMVDAMIWDDARPSVLTAAQLDALVEWVRHGGRLVLAASRSAAEIAQTQQLADILPVAVGDVRAIAALPTLRRSMLGDEDNAAYLRPIPVVQCTLRPDGREVLREDASGALIIARRRVGRGHVVFSAVTLKDLFSESGSARPFFRTVLSLSDRATRDDVALEAVSLFDRVVGAVSFAAKGGVYVLVAVLFSGLYVFVATFGSWSVLRAKVWLKHSWSVFALIAGAASVLSALAVVSIKGVGYHVHQMSIIDVDADDTYARGTVFFGLRTPRVAVLDMWLPSNYLSDTTPGATRCFLRPLPVANDPAQQQRGFVDPVSYRIRPATAVVEGVRVRGTLKRLEGRWEGPLAGLGRVRGHVRVKRHSGGAMDWRVTADSYVINDLGVPLRDCYLIHPLYDLANPSGRWAFDGVRGDRIYAYPIGTLPADGRKVMLAPRCYPTSPAEPVYKTMQRNTLAAQQGRWSEPFRGLSAYAYASEAGAAYTMGQEQNALLLLSTVGDFDPTKGARTAAFMRGLRTWSRDRLRQLDLREQLGRDSVYLLGWADDAGPVRLAVRKPGGDAYDTLTPDPGRAWTFYRVRIPVASVDDTPARDPDERGRRDRGDDEKGPYEP